MPDKIIISRPLRIHKLQDVYLNRGGRRIGMIAVVEGKFKSYVSHRKQEHYYKKNHGFALDKAVLQDCLWKYKAEHIIIEYRGVKGHRYFISKIDAWYDFGKPIAYTKEFDGYAETYGVQVALDEDYMTEYEVQI
jgi:hypothetical protein